MFRPITRRGLVCLGGRHFHFTAVTTAPRNKAQAAHTSPTSWAAVSAQIAQVRRQTTAAAATAGILADKKFHCSVCKKPFRLEKAAQVHIAQAHSGEGRVEAGPGPGYAESPTKPAAGSAPATQPTSPASPWKGQPMRGGVVNHSDEDDEYYKLRHRPVPKPLHAATIDVPDAAMEALLAVWDSIGVARVDSFVHSSMVMKVYATKQVDPATLPKAYEVNVTAPDGPSPFAVGTHATATGGDNDGGASTIVEGVAEKSSSPPPALSEDGAVDELRFSSTAFVPAPPQFISPLEPAAVPNPFLAPGSASQAAARPLAAASPPQSASTKAAQAPVTPYGQLPLFGSETTGGGLGSSSRFGAAAQASPFASPASGTGAAVDVGAASPFSGATNAAAAASSPFVGGAAGSSPFAAAPSPFASFASSPFAGSAPIISSTPFGMGAPDTSTPASDSASQASGLPPNLAGDSVPGHSAPYPLSEPGAPAVEKKQIVCSLCGKQFRHQFDFYNHSKSKHNIEVPRKSADSPQQKKAKDALPELPAYIPSPVDLTSTSPFGAAVHPSTSFAEVKLVLHGHAASNMTLLGQVVDVGSVDGSLRVGVMNDAQEVIPVHCGTPQKSSSRNGGSDTAGSTQESYAGELAATLKRGTTVLVTGTLRLIPRHEAHTNKVYMHPILFAVPPHGHIVAVDGGP